MFKLITAKEVSLEWSLHHSHLACEQALGGALAAAKACNFVCLWNLNSTSNSPETPRRLSCQISANQRDTEMSANVKNHEKNVPKVMTSLLSSPISIRHLHISHNAPYLPPKSLHNLCFSFLLGITAVPREIQNNA